MFIINPYVFSSVVPYANNYSIIFDGVNERLKSADDVLDITGAMSVSFWMKTTSTGSLNCQLCKDTTGGSNRSWNITWRGSGAGLRQLFIFFWNTSGALNSHASTANILDDGAWHHIVWTYDGTSGANGSKLYIDGTLDTQLTASSTGIRNYTGANSDICIGSTSGATGGWFNEGSIDEPAIWDGTALSSGDVTTIYNGGSPDDLTGLTPTAWWRMGDYAGDVITNIQDAAGTADLAHENMESGDIQSDVP